MIGRGRKKEKKKEAPAEGIATGELGSRVTTPPVLEPRASTDERISPSGEINKRTVHETRAGET